MNYSEISHTHPFDTGEQQTSGLDPEAVVRFSDTGEYSVSFVGGELCLVSEVIYVIEEKAKRFNKCSLLIPGQKWKQGKLKITVNIQFEEDTKDAALTEQE
ncbi:MAG: hypothetical protein F6K21_05610 [Symploca sp. SIO2D2]|nr:hypothetical protein [Symploca sp. SIO2D2]